MPCHRTCGIRQLDLVGEAMQRQQLAQDRERIARRSARPAHSVGAIVDEGVESARQNRPEVDRRLALPLNAREVDVAGHPACDRVGSLVGTQFADAENLLRFFVVVKLNRYLQFLLLRSIDQDNSNQQQHRNRQEHAIEHVEEPSQTRNRIA